MTLRHVSPWVPIFHDRNPWNPSPRIVRLAGAVHHGTLRIGGLRLFAFHDFGISVDIAPAMLGRRGLVVDDRGTARIDKDRQGDFDIEIPENSKKKPVVEANISRKRWFCLS